MKKPKTTVPQRAAEPDADDYRAKGDAQTLMEAQQIHLNPARRRAAMPHVRMHAKAAQAVIGKKTK